MNEIEFILYVSNQENSKEFYAQLFRINPSLHVPGMTEFQLTKTVKLGLMPDDGIAKIIADRMPHPSSGTGIPRCELYMKVENAAEVFERGIQLGGTEISALQNRDWGDTVGYLADLDGHVIAVVEA